MAKPMPTGCLQYKKEITMMKQFNMMLETVNLGEKRGHIFVLDIEFDKKRAKKKILMFKFIVQFFNKKGFGSCQNIYFPNFGDNHAR